MCREPKAVSKKKVSPGKNRRVPRAPSLLQPRLPEPRIPGAELQTPRPSPSAELPSAQSRARSPGNQCLPRIIPTSDRSHAPPADRPSHKHDVDFTCTRSNLSSVSTTKSHRELSPHGFDTPAPAPWPYAEKPPPPSLPPTSGSAAAHTPARPRRQTTGPARAHISLHLHKQTSKCFSTEDRNRNHLPLQTEDRSLCALPIPPPSPRKSDRWPPHTAPNPQLLSPQPRLSPHPPLFFQQLPKPKRRTPNGERQTPRTDSPEPRTQSREP